MTMTPDEIRLAKSKLEAKRQLWHKGELSWKFRDYPWAKDLYKFIRENWGASPHLDVMMHRRGAKSTTCEIIGIEECIRVARTTCGVLCTTKEQARQVCEESFAAILDDCPKAIAPRRVKNDFTWVFDHNDSRIIILSADRLNAKSGRGRKFRFIHVMEAAFIPGLRKILRSVLLPTLRDVTGRSNGLMVLESTPPDDDVAEEDIEDWEKIWAEAELEHRTFFLPLSKNTHASPDFVAACKKDSGGEESSEYQREYELKLGVKSRRTVVPEFTHERAFIGVDGKPPVVREVPRPPGADRYESLDPGGDHPTALLFGFYHFEEDLVVIEDEWFSFDATTDVIAAAAKEREQGMWAGETGKLLRVSDNNRPITLRDMHRLHGLVFYETRKDEKEAQINKTRVMFRDHRIAIHPRCTRLIKTLRIARRSKNKHKGFMEQEGIGHADLLDCLLYLVRNVRKHQMPDVAPTPTPADFARPAPPPQANVARKFSRAAFGRALRRW